MGRWQIPSRVPKDTRPLERVFGDGDPVLCEGMTTGEIQAHLEEIYATELLLETISKMTSYPVLLIDANVIKVRDA